eukprot:1178840-Rhodomonas_salina.1
MAWDAFRTASGPSDLTQAHSSLRPSHDHWQTGLLLTSSSSGWEGSLEGSGRVIHDSDPTKSDHRTSDFFGSSKKPVGMGWLCRLPLRASLATELCYSPTICVSSIHGSSSQTRRFVLCCRARELYCLYHDLDVLFVGLVPAYHLCSAQAICLGYCSCLFAQVEYIPCEPVLPQIPLHWQLQCSAMAQVPGVLSSGFTLNIARRNSYSNSGLLNDLSY